MKWIIVLLLLFSSQNLRAEDPPAPSKGDAGKTEIVGTIKTPKVYFTNLKDGQEVKKKFTAKFGIDGMSIKPAGEMSVGSGHHHVIIDGAAIPKGQVVPLDDKNLHFGKGQTSAELTLTPGLHTLTLQFADGSHLSYGPELSQTITVKVK